jgi:hypothetical protein
MSLAGDTRDGPLQKLPLWNTICLSYSTYFRNFLDVLLICWLWLIVVAPLMAVVTGMERSWIAGATAELNK